MACLWRLAIVSLSLTACRVSTEAPAKPNIVWVILDTTRADRLGCSGYPSPTTPNIDRFAKDAVRMTEAWSPSSWTLPAVASLLTGQYPTSHGAHFHPNGTVTIDWAVRIGPHRGNHRAHPLGMDPPTVTEVLSHRGWMTGGFVAGPWMKRTFGLHRGFAHYDDSGIATINGRPGANVTTSALSWIDALGGQPFFLLANYFEPHFPYVPSAHDLSAVTAGLDDKGRRDPDGRTAALERLKYDGEVRGMDRQVGRLLRGLRDRHLYDEAWIVIVADHGELLGEHDTWGHGEHLTEEETHVPLLLKPPKGHRLTARGSEPVQLVDIAPTLLDAVGIPIPNAMQGGVLPRVSHPIFAELYPGEGPESEGNWRLLVDGRWVFVWNSRGNHLLIHRDRGPVQDEPRAQLMRARLTDFVESLPVAAPRAHGLPELESLHYVP